MVVEIEEMSTTKKMYGWTKYGGARKGLVQEELDEWYCQTCGRRQTKELPYYMVPLDVDIRREFVRVCSECKNQAIKKRIDAFEALAKKVREGLSFDRVANLLSFPIKI